MAVKVELHRSQVQHALELTINSIRRAAKAAVNPGIKQLLEKDLAEYSQAANTLTETK